MEHIKMLEQREGPVDGNRRKDLATRASGRFYTHEVIGKHLVSAVLGVFRGGSDAQVEVVDPFCGDGRLICWLIEGMGCRDDLRALKWRAHLWEYDKEALRKAQNNVTDVANRHGIRMDVAVMRGDTFEICRDSFGRFDIVITNPPWETLKPDSRELSGMDEAEVARYVEAMRSYAEMLIEHYPMSKSQGGFLGRVVNLSRYGAEVALRLTNRRGICGLVSPASLLADRVSISLREWIIRAFQIHDIAFFPAEARLFSEVDQPALTLVVSPGSAKTVSPKVAMYGKERKKLSQRRLVFGRDYLAKHGFVIPVHFGLEACRILPRLEGLPMFRDLEGSGPTDLWAGRELDETRHEGFLGGKGNYLFLKGGMIKRFGIVTPPSRYVKTDGPRIPRSADYCRVAWRDVSRPTQKRRIQAALIPPGWVTGNSLNVACFHDNDVARTKALLAVMNSLVFEFQVRSSLSTAHVSLSTVRGIHMPNLRDSEVVRRLAALADGCLSNCEAAQADAEVEVARLYGLSQEEFGVLLSSFDRFGEEEVSELLRHGLWRAGVLDSGEETDPTRSMSGLMRIPNHYSAKLSALDLSIVRSVPPGGNWKDVPASVPSKRLDQIRKSYTEGKGSRSTYYGRLHPDSPAYTISTHFTRPGNGCNIHYDFEGGQHRVISSREAARLQSFPDSFEFRGSKTTVRQEIGNAVPPLMAFQIARSLPYRGEFVDLFCGAGGLSLGFKWAGWEPLLANDVRKEFLETYSSNVHDETVLGDLRDEMVFNSVVKRTQELRRGGDSVPLMVIGGPPCQGFSTAGRQRSMTDERNWLFTQFISALEELRPSGFVFENVPGLLNMQGGAVFAVIMEQLRKTAKFVEVWKLDCVEYGIPQRRKRVFVVGSSNSEVAAGVPKSVTAFGLQRRLLGECARAVSVSEALSDLPPLEPGEDGSMRSYAGDPKHSFQAFCRSLISPEEYLQDIAKVG